MMKKYMKPTMVATETDLLAMIAESVPIGDGTVEPGEIEGKRRDNRDDNNDAWSNGLW